MTIALRSHDGRVVATLDGDTLKKRVIEAKHKPYTPLAAEDENSWCIDLDVIEQAVALGATRIEIIATDTGQTYRASMTGFLEKAKKINRDHCPCGDEHQLALEGGVAMIYPANYPPGMTSLPGDEEHYLACTSHEDDSSWDLYDPKDSNTIPNCTCDQIAEDDRYAAADEKLASMKDEGELE